MAIIKKNLKIKKGKDFYGNYSTVLSKELKGVIKRNINSSNTNVSRSSKILSRSQQKVETVNVTPSNMRNSSGSNPRQNTSYNSNSVVSNNINSVSNVNSVRIFSSNVNSSKTIPLVSIKKNGVNYNVVDRIVNQEHNMTDIDLYNSRINMYNEEFERIGNMASIESDYKKDGYKYTSGPLTSIAYSKVKVDGDVRKYYDSEGSIVKEVYSNGSVHFPTTSYSNGEYYDIGKDGSLSIKKISIDVPNRTKDYTLEDSQVIYPNGYLLYKKLFADKSLSVRLSGPDQPEAYSYSKDANGVTYETLPFVNKAVKIENNRVYVDNVSGDDYVVNKDGSLKVFDTIDGVKKAIYSVSPDGKSSSISYNENGSKKSTVDSSGKTTQYYENGNIKQEIISDDHFKKYNQNGSLIEDHISDQNFKVYDDNGKLVKNVVDGKVLFEKYPSGQVKHDVIKNVDFTFNEDGTVAQKNGIAVDSNLKVRVNGDNVELYNANSNLVDERIYSDGSRERYSYNGNQISNYQNIKSDGSYKDYNYRNDGSRYLAADHNGSTGNTVYYDELSNVSRVDDSKGSSWYLYRDDGSQYVYRYYDNFTNEYTYYDQFGNVVQQ